MTKRTRIIILTIQFIVIAAIIAGIIYLVSVSSYKAAVSNMTYSDVDISSVPDGSYIGECDVGFIYAKVEVTMEDGVMTRIDLLEHKNGQGKNAEGIEDDIVAQQKVDVDGISGATNSSKVIKKAVDNALTGVTGQ